MLILIAPEKDFNSELTLLNQLFEAGLECFHLRKPEKNYEEHCAFLDQIDSKYHNRIVLHLFHELVNTYNLKGIHFQEQKRRDSLDVPSNYFRGLSMYGKTISSSFHEPKDIEKCEFEFDYHLLSPVFNSISKEGYEGRGFNVAHINKWIIGMGGASTTNLGEFTKLGFNGVAVLGGIWNSSSPVQDFKIMRDHFTQANTQV
ncbi:MAG: thiamine-phosphate pyrophosphorylase [Crocinitomicaceae bacterium]|jgi:thiamine-phosphate pyrophosphorylase